MKKLNLKKKPAGRPAMKEGAKAKVFSVSFRESDLDEIAAAIAGMKLEYGAKVSRNELVRRATIAHVRFIAAKKKGKTPDYQEILEAIE